MTKSIPLRTLIQERSMSEFFKSLDYDTYTLRSKNKGIIRLETYNGTSAEIKINREDMVSSRMVKMIMSFAAL